jgi:hypothetical protein
MVRRGLRRREDLAVAAGEPFNVMTNPEVTSDTADSD